MIVRFAAAVLLAAPVMGCAEPLDFAAWDIPVGPGVRVIEYAPARLDERNGEIGLQRDLRIGGDLPDAGGPFYFPSDIAVAADGSIYVFDAGNQRIQVFDATGRFVTSIGRAGQGPGEIERAGDIAIVGERLVRSGDRKLSVWRLDGTHVADNALLSHQSLLPVAALGSNRLFGGHSRVNEDDTQTDLFSAFSLDAELDKTFAEFTFGRRLKTLRDDSGFTIVRLPGPTPSFAVSRAGDVYVSAANEYQVHAFDGDGNVRWALRTAWTRTPVDATDCERAMLRSVSGGPAPDDLDVDWPARNPALMGLAGTAGAPALQVDGHGHLFVFPFVREAVGGRFPVDVYSAAGERLFAGWIADNDWRDALDDFVYDFDDQEEGDRHFAVRYRLVEPFR